MEKNKIRNYKKHKQKFERNKYVNKWGNYNEKLGEKKEIQIED